MDPGTSSYIFRSQLELTDEGPDVTREVDGIVRELGYLALAITLAGSYVSVTARLLSDRSMGQAAYKPIWRKRFEQMGGIGRGNCPLRSAFLRPRG